jgi:hypothetical protein
MVCAWLDVQSTCGDYTWTCLEESRRLRTMAPILAPKRSWSFPRKLRAFAGDMRAHRGKKLCDPVEHGAARPAGTLCHRASGSLGWLTTGGVAVVGA